VSPDPTVDRLLDGLFQEPRENVHRGMAEGHASMGSVATAKTPLAGGGSAAFVAVTFVTVVPGKGELFAFEVERILERYLGGVKEKVFYHKRVDGSEEPCEHVKAP